MIQCLQTVSVYSPRFWFMSIWQADIPTCAWRFVMELANHFLLKKSQVATVAGTLDPKDLGGLAQVNVRSIWERAFHRSFLLRPYQLQRPHQSASFIIRRRICRSILVNCALVIRKVNACGSGSGFITDETPKMQFVSRRLRNSPFELEAISISPQLCSNCRWNARSEPCQQCSAREFHCSSRWKLLIIYEYLCRVYLSIRTPFFNHFLFLSE